MDGSFIYGFIVIIKKYTVLQTKEYGNKLPFRPKAFLMKVKNMIMSATPANNPIIIANVFSASSCPSAKKSKLYT